MNPTRHRSHKATRCATATFAAVGLIAVILALSVVLQEGAGKRAALPGQVPEVAIEAHGHVCDPSIDGTCDHEELDSASYGPGEEERILARARGGEIGIRPDLRLNNSELWDPTPMHLVTPIDRDATKTDSDLAEPQESHKPIFVTPGEISDQKSAPKSHERHFAESGFHRFAASFPAGLAARSIVNQVGVSSVVGKWDAPMDTPVNAIHASLLPSGKVLAYSSSNNNSAAELATDQSFTTAMLFDPVTNGVTNVDERLGFNIFCSGLAKLMNGALFVAGGNKDQALNGINRTATFDFETSQWTAGANMSVERWYPSVTPLPNGESLILNGGPDLPEVRTTSGSIRALSAARSSLFAQRTYPFIATDPAGRAVYLGPSDSITEITTGGTGALAAPKSRDGKNRSYGSFAMYQPNKVLVAGGGFSDNSVSVIDMNTKAVSPATAMNYQRRQHQVTVLADGSVLATGGIQNSTESLVDLNNAVYNAERWDPSTGKWTILAPAARVRQYHSTALLLPDGRVFTGGGGQCNPCDSRGYLQRNVEIFNPPYLFNVDGTLANRPTISSVPSSMGYVGSFAVGTPNSAGIVKAALVRMGSVTHSVDMEQRYVPLTFVKSSGQISVTAPSNANVAPPGYYMLFLVDGNGVPSVSRPVLIDPSVPAPSTTTTAVPTSTSTSTSTSSTTTTSTTTTSTTTTTKASTTTTSTTAVAVATTTTTPTSPTTTILSGIGSTDIYTEGLSSTWQDWSWATHADVASPARGTRSVSFVPQAWQGLYFHTDRLGSAGNSLEFWVNGGSGSNQAVQVFVQSNGVTLAQADVGSLVGGMTGTWKKATLSVASGISGSSPIELIFQAYSSSLQPTVYFDDIKMLDSRGSVTSTIAATTSTAATTTSPATTTTTSATTTTRPPTTTTLSATNTTTRATTTTIPVATTTIQASVTTTSIAGNGSLTVTPSQVKVGQQITATLSGLAPSNGLVGFTIGGIPAGTVAVDPTGRASLTTGVWSTGTLAVLARWEAYPGGVYVSKEWTVPITSNP